MKLFFIFIIYLSFIKANIKINDIKSNKNYIIIQQNKTNYFSISHEQGFNNINSLKIQIIYKEKQNVHKAILYYGEDSTFTERKQISHNTQDSLFLWLTNEQIKNKFFITIDFLECSEEFPCKYNLEISLFSNNIILSLGEQYSYFVTKENKGIIFIFRNNESINKKNNLIIWAKGNKNIYTSLYSIKNYEKHSKYNVYNVKFDNSDNDFFYYNLELNATEGDFINIGSLLFDENLTCSTIFNEEIEMTGFLKKGIIDKNCFKMPKNNNIVYFQKVVYDNKEININTEKDNNNNLLYCVEIPEEYDEVFYSIYYLNDNNNKNKIKYSSLLLYNADYYVQINKNTTVGLIPISQYENINYLSYNINPLNGKYKFGKYICNNYPLCSFYLNYSYEEIKYLNSFFLSFTKSNFIKNNNCISSEQNILLLKSDENINDNYLYINIYSEKDTTILKPDILYSRYIRRLNNEIFLINHKNDKNLKSIFIFIEIISGYIKFNYFKPDKYTRFRSKNKRLYIVYPDYQNDTNISFNIISISNSFYKIIYTNNYDDNIKLDMIDINYLISFTQKQTIKLNYETLSIDDTNFIGFYPLNCSFNITSKSITKILNKKNNSLYQEIKVKNKNDNQNLYSYEISNINENDKNKTCMLCISLFKLNSMNSNILDGIILANNISQLFMFNKDNSNFNYLYLFSTTDKNLYLNLQLYDKEQYQLSLCNDEKMKYDIISNKTIKINNIIDLKTYCQNYQQLCNISFNIISKKILNESIIKIKVYLDYSKNKEDKNKEKNENESFFRLTNPIFAIILVASGLLILIIILVVIIIMFRFRNNDLNSQVNAISFKYGNRNDSDDEDINIIDNNNESLLIKND